MGGGREGGAKGTCVTEELRVLFSQDLLMLGKSKGRSAVLRDGHSPVMSWFEARAVQVGGQRLKVGRVRGGRLLLLLVRATCASADINNALQQPDQSQ